MRNAKELLMVKTCVSMILPACWWAPMAAGQSEESPEQERAAVLSPTTFGSSQADSYAGALGPFADGLGAAVENPAGIGGLHAKQQKKRSWIRQFHFPYAYGAFNENSRKLSENMGLQGGISKADVKEAMDESLAGKAQYGRASIFPNAGVGRMVVGPVYDVQLAATAPYKGAETVELKYRKKTGAGLGLSLADPKGNLYLGLFAHYLSVEQISGSYTAEQVVDEDATGELMSEELDKFSALGMDAGAVWLINAKASPVLSMSIKDAGQTEYTHSSGPGSTFKVNENIGVAFGISPKMFRNSYYNLSIAMDDLTNGDKALAKKWHISTGATFGGRGILSLAGLNVGANQAGVAYGGHLNIGLIGVQYANFAVDVGFDDHRVIERRQSGVVSINLAE